jgi:hypothetical protein
VVLLGGGEAAAVEGRRLDEGDVDRRVGRDPVVEGELGHGLVVAVPAVAEAGADRRHAVGERPVLDLVVGPVGRPPGATEGIAEAVGVDVVPRADAVQLVVEGVVSWCRPIGVEAQDLATEGIEVEGGLGLVAVAVVDVEPAVGAQAEVRDLMRRALGLPLHVEHHLRARRGAAAVVAVEADHPRIERAEQVPVDEAGEDVPRAGMDDEPGQALLAGAGEVAGGVEVEQPGRVVRDRPVPGDHLDRPVELGDV